MSDRARLRIAFQGELGSFSDEAIQQLYGADVQRLPYRDFADVTASVASGVADRGVQPIENTMAGSNPAAHDAIAARHGDLRRCRRDSANAGGIDDSVVARAHRAPTRSDIRACS